MNTPVSGSRLLSPRAWMLVPALAACAGTASAAVSNLDPELQTGPTDFVLGGELQSRQIDQGVVRYDNTAAHVSGSGRFGILNDGPDDHSGLGAQVDGYFAVGEDRRSPTRTVEPGEMTELNAKVDYLYDVHDPNTHLPFIQVIPHYEYVTYPNVSPAQNYLKDHESWLGSELWYATPLDGIELGGDVDWDLNHHAHMFRSALGVREFYQDVPFDLRGWQLVNLGNKDYTRYLFGGDSSGVTTIDIGGRLTLPLPWEESWYYVQGQAVYWADSKDRKVLRTEGQDAGEFIIAVGMEWRPD
jgi:hypothetical protein